MGHFLKTGESVEETLKEILRTLQDHGSVLRHIDQRFDTMEKMIELVRLNQSNISERENSLETQCRHQHRSVDDTLHSLARRITSLEARLTPVPKAPEKPSELTEQKEAP